MKMGDSKLVEKLPLEIIKEEGDNLTYHIKSQIKSAGVFRYALRVILTMQNCLIVKISLMLSGFNVEVK